VSELNSEVLELVGELGGGRVVCESLGEGSERVGEILDVLLVPRVLSGELLSSLPKLGRPSIGSLRGDVSFDFKRSLEEVSEVVEELGDSGERKENKPTRREKK